MKSGNCRDVGVLAINQGKLHPPADAVRRDLGGIRLECLQLVQRRRREMRAQVGEHALGRVPRVVEAAAAGVRLRRRP